MKNLKNYIKAFGIGIVLIMSSSCEKFLETSPDLRADVDTPEKVGLLLVKAYPSGNYIHFAETASDNVADKGPRTSGVEHTSLNRSVYEFKDPEESGRDTPIRYWNSAYEAIAAANHALRAVEQATTDKQAYLPYKGEALLARAYAHFMLVTFFAKAYDPDSPNDSPGIPYVTEPERVVQPTYERKTVAYVYDMIEKDLTEGIKLIDNSVYKAAPKYHFTTSAAHAFASRFYLFKKEYEKVIEHSSAITPGGDYRGFLRPWISEMNVNWTTTEMREWYTASNQRSNLLLIETTSKWGADYYKLRFAITYDLNQIRMSDENVTGAGWGQKTSAYNSSVNRRHNKFVSHNVRSSLTSSTITRRTIVPALTTEESLLNRAEAYAMVGEFDKAIADLDLYASQRIVNYNKDMHGVTFEKIEDFYGITDPQAGLIKTTLDFKRSEFVQEGIRWFDMLRHKVPVRHEVLDEYGYVDEVIEIGPEDPRRMFQLPEETKLAGLELNPRP